MSEQTSYQQVTISSYPSTFDANLARTALEAEGIESYLEGEHAAETLWHYINAFGGIKLQVATTSQEAARRVLDEMETQQQVNRTEKEYKPESLESQVNRALKASVLGLIFLPVIMHFYSVHTLRRMSFREVLDSSFQVRKRFFIAYAVNLAVLTLFFMVIFFWVFNV